MMQKWKLLQVVKSNSILLPLLFGLFVEIDHITASKTLWTQISTLGYAISYDQVKRYKQSVWWMKTTS